MNDTSDSPPLTIEVGDGAHMEELLRRDTVLVRTRHGLRLQEAAMIETLPEGKSGRFLVAQSREGITAEVLAGLNPAATIVDWYDDAFHAARARERHASMTANSRIEIVLSADLPCAESPWDGIFLMLSRHGDSDLADELIRQAAAGLEIKGVLRAAVDNQRDTFVRDRMKRRLGDVSIADVSGLPAVVAVARKKKAIVAPRTWCERFEVKEGETSLGFDSRPGMFAAGRLDDGARAILAELAVADGEALLDLGCGAGVIGITAAHRAALSRLVLVDASARAAEIATRNAERLLGDRVPWNVILTAHADRDVTPPGFDLIVANPPYFADGGIAESFMEMATRLLAPDGRYLVVSKLEEWHAEHLATRFAVVERRRRGGYGVFLACRPRRAST